METTASVVMTTYAGDDQSELRDYFTSLLSFARWTFYISMVETAEETAVERVFGRSVGQ